MGASCVREALVTLCDRGPAPFPTVALFLHQPALPNPFSAAIDTTFPKGQALAVHDRRVAPSVVSSSIVDWSRRRMLCQHALGLACALMSLHPRAADAQATPEPPPAWSVAQRPMHLELGVPEGVALTIRPQAGGEPVACPPQCTLTVYPGKYRLDAKPPPQSPWRRVVRTVEIADDVHLRVVPGDRGEHGWGLALTISGGVVFGLGMMFYAVTHMSGANPSTGSEVATLGMMGVGIPVTASGIYLLVHARNRVIMERPGQRQLDPLPPSSSSGIHVGWRF